MIEDFDTLLPLRVYQSDRYSDQYYVYIGKKHLKVYSEYSDEVNGEWILTQPTYVNETGYMFIELTSPEHHWLERKILPVEAIIKNHLWGGKIAFLWTVSKNKYPIPLDIHLDLDHCICSLDNKEFTVGPMEYDSTEYTVVIEDME